MKAVWSNFSFSHLLSIPERCSHTATVIGNDIYIIGGGICVNNSTEWRHYGDIWKVTPEMKEIQKIEPVNGDITPRRGHSAVNYQNRWIIVFGGFIQVNHSEAQDEDGMNHTPSLTNDLQIFDIKTLKWLSVTQRGDVPYPRRGHIASHHQNKMIVFGGDSNRLGDSRSISELDLTPLSVLMEDDTLLNSIELTWRDVRYSGDVIPPLLSLTAYSTARSGIFIYGGTCLDYFTMTTNPSKRLFFFDLRDYSFHDLFLLHRQRSLPEPRFCATMVHLNDDAFILYGGTTPTSEYSSTIYLFQVIPLVNAPPDLSLSSASQSGEHYQIIWVPLPLPSQDSAFSPRARNGMILVPSSQQPNFPLLTSNAATTASLSQPSIASSSLQLSFLMFGGGIYPLEYFNDWWELEIIIPPELLLKTFLFPSSSASTPSLDLSQLPHLVLYSQHCCSSSPIPLPNLLLSLSSSTPSSPHHDNLSDPSNSDNSDSSDLLLPVHLDILTTSCDYFRSLLSSQWNDLQSGVVKVYEYYPPLPLGDHGEDSITLTLPVVHICDVDFEMLSVILMEIYQHHLHKTYPSPEGKNSPLPPADISIECYLTPPAGEATTFSQLARLIHTFSQFQLISSQYKCEKYLAQKLSSVCYPPSRPSSFSIFSFLSSSSRSIFSHLLDDFTFLWHLLVLCQSCHMILLPSLLTYHFRTACKIALQAFQIHSLESQREEAEEEDEKKVMEMVERIKDCLNEDESQQLPLGLREGMLNLIEEFEQKTKVA
jgi:hypothetical protein